MQRKHGPIRISHETARLIVDNLRNPGSSKQKKKFVRESLVIASKVKTKDLKVMG